MKRLPREEFCPQTGNTKSFTPLSFTQDTQIQSNSLYLMNLKGRHGQIQSVTTENQIQCYPRQKYAHTRPFVDPSHQYLRFSRIVVPFEYSDVGLSLSLVEVGGGKTSDLFDVRVDAL
jgi:hypothetical protein